MNSNEQAPSKLAVNVTVLVFVGVFVAGLVFFLRNSGASVPVVDQAPWHASFVVDDVKNLKVNSEVSIAGVVIGRVSELEPDGRRTEVSIDLDQGHGALRTGATARIGVKSVIGQSYVDVVDGSGEPMADGVVLADDDVVPAVDIDEVINTLDPRTRTALREVIRGLGIGTADQAQALDQLMTGLGDLGREGTTVVGAISAQSEDLEALVREAGRLMHALDEGQGQIVEVVTQARDIVAATSAEDAALRESVTKLPGLIGSADAATNELGQLATSLAPVAADLRAAAPGLDQALTQLPSISHELNKMVAPLDGALRAAPATLQRIPAFDRDVTALIPQLEVLLSDVNPMLAYLEPYGRDIGAMFGSFGASMDVAMENGVKPIRLAPVFNAGSLRGNPLPLTIDPTTWINPYPRPGTAGQPQPGRGAYPRIERDGR